MKNRNLGADGGTESGHALGICNSLNSGKYDVELIGLYGDDAEETKALATLQELFLEAIKTGKGDDSEEMLFSTVLSNALQRSLESGKEIIIGEVKR